MKQDLIARARERKWRWVEMGLFKKKPKTLEEAHRPTSASKKTFEIRRKRTVGG